MAHGPQTMVSQFVLLVFQSYLGLQSYLQSYHQSTGRLFRSYLQSYSQRVGQVASTRNHPYSFQASSDQPAHHTSKADPLSTCTRLPVFDGLPSGSSWVRSLSGFRSRDHVRVRLPDHDGRVSLPDHDGRVRPPVSNGVSVSVGATLCGDLVRRAISSSWTLTVRTTLLSDMTDEAPILSDPWHKFCSPNGTSSLAQSET